VFLSELLYVRDHFPVLLLLRPPLIKFFLGRDRDYQDLNLGFVFNVAISATIISWFPKPLKRCVVPIYPCFFVNETPL
jgi:hypothetical protein